MTEENVKTEINEIRGDGLTSHFEKELSHIINKYSQENMSDTPDFILAKYLSSCLTAYSIAVTRRDKWFGVDMWNKKESTLITERKEGESLLDKRVDIDLFKIKV